MKSVSSVMMEQEGSLERLAQWLVPVQEQSLSGSIQEAELGCSEEWGPAQG
jgi:hypothetical protein